MVYHPIIALLVNVVKTMMFLPHFDVLCDLLRNRRTATWNLFVLHNKELKYTGKNYNDDVIYTSVLQ